jgi:flagellar FliL protein
VNFKDAYGDPHFMQVTMEVMSRDQEAVNAVRDHTPAIRNALILMFGQAKYERVVTREGKEELLDDALVEIQGVLTDRIGEPGVEEVYFTALVIQ